MAVTVLDSRHMEATRMERQRKARGTRLGAIVVSITALLLVTAGGTAAQPVLGGFQGSWTTIDCADGGGGLEPDCNVWGDGSRFTMQIGFGKNPKVTIKDDYSSACVDGGAAGTRWAGSGSGWYTQAAASDGGPGPIYLHVVLTKAGCGSFATIGDLGRDISWNPDPLVLEFYHDLGSDTIWFDPDGINGGLDWYRTN
jgi:hypothetical protein